MTPYPIHPAAEMLPEMSDEEFDELVADVAKNGIRENIELLNGHVIDGRHRQKAGFKLGIDMSSNYITVDEFSIGNNPYAHVISKNICRRHLKTSQRAMCMGKIRKAADSYERESSINARSPSLPQLAKSAGVSPRLIGQATAVAEKGSPELVKAVEKGEITVGTAMKLVKAEPDKKKQAEILRSANAKEEVKQRISGGTSFDVSELEGAPQEGERKQKNGAPVIEDLSAVQADLKEFESKLRELARFGRQILGAKGSEITRPWCSRYSLLTVIQPLQHVARTIANDMPVGGTPADPKLHREVVAENAA